MPMLDVEASPVDRFHECYYGADRQTWKNTFWLGTQILKCPLDLWIYQEIVHEIRPDLIIETGTFRGGTAHFLALVCDHLAHGEVLTVDIKEHEGRPEHPRITYLSGSSTDETIVTQVRDRARDHEVVMVILDSLHRKDHVLAELHLYAPLVTPGSYLIVEDTNVNGHPVRPDFGPGPMEAVEEFLAATGDFVVDSAREKLIMTFNPGGYLKRIDGRDQPKPPAEPGRNASSDAPPGSGFGTPSARTRTQSLEPGSDQTRAADLYLDLLKRCLTRLLFEDDVSIPRRSQQGWDRAVRIERRDWPARAETMIGMHRLDNLQYCVSDVLQRGVTGDLIETGVWRGGATILMRAILAAHGDEDRLVWAADSFAGLPPPNPDQFPADQNDRHFQHEVLAVSLEEVKTNFARYGLLDDRVRFLVGWFRDTLPAAPIDQLAVLRLDGDMYESTMIALTYLYPKLSAGGYVIADDYGAIPSCRKAVDEFRQQFGIEEPVERIDWTGVYWRKR